jgi:hypothetical protein
MGAEIKPSDFKAPANWTAPYGPYSAGWWDVFLPNKQ